MQACSSWATATRIGYARAAADLPVTADGVRGGCVGDDSFRRRAIQAAVRHRPRVAVIMAGGNDLARPSCRLRNWLGSLQELVLGVLAAGATVVWIMPIPPRSGLRPTDVSARQFRRRRWVANRLLRRLFRRAPAMLMQFSPPADFLGRDGVHPSAAGWRALEAALRNVLAVSAAMA